MNIIQVLRQYNPKSMERRWNKFGLAPLGVYFDSLYATADTNFCDEVNTRART